MVARGPSQVVDVSMCSSAPLLVAPGPPSSLPEALLALQIVRLPGVARSKPR